VRHRLSAQIMCIVVLTGGMSMLSTPANAATSETSASDEQTSTAFVNQKRSDRNRSKLATNAQLTEIARRHAIRMADDADLYHNPNLGREADGYDRLGENVGLGYSVDAIDEAFWASDDHRINILGSFAHVGLGVVERQGDVYVVQVFGHPDNARAEPPADRDPKPKAKPKPKKAKPRKRTAAMSASSRPADQPSSDARVASDAPVAAISPATAEAIAPRISPRIRPARGSGRGAYAILKPLLAAILETRRR
jgi:hypothetical protein